MFPYWLLFSVFAAGTIQYGRQGQNRLQSNPLLLVAGLLVALLIGLRFEVGGDWGNYLEILDNSRNFELGEILTLPDPGYMLVNWVSQALGLDVWFVNLVCASLFTWGLIKFARQQPNPWLAICVAVPYLIIVVAMGYSRQAVAIGMIMAGLVALKNQAFIRFAIYIVVAATFHKTAIIVLPLVALTTERHRFVIGAMMAVMAYLLYGWFLQAGMDKFVTNYIEGEYGSQGAAIRVVMNVVPAALFLLFSKRFGLSEAQRKLWRNFSLAAFGTLFLLFLLPSSTAVDRLALYIIPLQLFTLSRIPDAFPNRDGSRNGQMVLLVILYSAVVQFIWLNYAEHAEYWVPYRLFPLGSEDGVSAASDIS